MASGQRLATNMADLTQRVDKAFNIGQRWNAAKAFAVSRPKTSLFLLAILVTFSIPITAFIIVIGFSLFIGFATLLWVQGAVLTIATAVLLPTLGFCALIAAGLTSAIYGTGYMADLLRSAWWFVYDEIFPNIAATVSRLTNIWGRPTISELEEED